MFRLAWIVGITLDIALAFKDTVSFFSVIHNNDNLVDNYIKLLFDFFNFFHGYLVFNDEFDDSDQYAEDKYCLKECNYS